MLFSCVVGVSGLREEFNLLRDVLTLYDPAARPVLNLTDVVEVRMGIALFQIRDLVRICKSLFLEIQTVVDQEMCTYLLFVLPIPCNQRKLILLCTSY